MANQPKTPAHAVRVPDELWGRATAYAATNGGTMSDLIRCALAAYISTAPDDRDPLGTVRTFYEATGAHGFRRFDVYERARVSEWKQTSNVR